jgi:radical SAM protein with 4Fe4S-binding SPASM domain
MSTINETIAKNLERVSQLVDQSVQTHCDDMPLFSWLELSTIDVCNRACVFCPKSNDNIAPNQPHAVLPPVLYKKMAAELSDLKYQGTIMLAGYGEPMLHPNLNDLISTFSAVCNTEITTNGDLLNLSSIQGMISAGISKIIVSMYDGPHQTEYFTSLFEQAEAPEETYILRDRWYASDKDFGVKLTNRGGTITSGDQDQVDIKHACYYPHYMMMIDWNGDCFLCTQDWNRRKRSGNAMLQPLIEIWDSKMLRQFRTRLSKGKRDMSPCSNCNADGTLHGEKHADSWTSYYKAKKRKKRS